MGLLESTFSRLHLQFEVLQKTPFKIHTNIGLHCGMYSHIPANFCKLFDQFMFLRMDSKVVFFMDVDRVCCAEK